MCETNAEQVDAGTKKKPWKVEL